MGSGIFGPAVAGPVPTPLYVANCKPATLGFLEILCFDLFNYVFLIIIFVRNWWVFLKPVTIILADLILVVQQTSIKGTSNVPNVS